MGDNGFGNWKNYVHGNHAQGHVSSFSFNEKNQIREIKMENP